MTSPSKNVWAFLHGELSPEKKEHFNQALLDDPSLLQAFEERYASHTALKESLAAPSDKIFSDEELTEKLIAEWAAEHPEQLDEPNQKKPKRKILYFTAPLAAAAALVVFLALPSNPIRWKSTAFGNAPQLRGETSGESFYSRPQLKQAVNKLQETVEISCDPSTKWTLRIYLQELAEGALAIEISGHSNTPAKTSKVWEKTFQSLEDFLTKVPMLGKQIAGEL